MGKNKTEKPIAPGGKEGKTQQLEEKRRMPRGVYRDNYSAPK